MIKGLKCIIRLISKRQPFFVYH